MKEQLISFKTALLAKEKGLDNIGVEGYYHINEGYKKGYAFCYSNISKQNEFALLAPTQSLLQKWLREVYNIHISINCVLPRNGKQFEAYVCKITTQEMIDKVDLSKYLKLTDLYLKYEEALEIGLQEALKLI